MTLQIATIFSLSLQNFAKNAHRRVHFENQIGTRNVNNKKKSSCRKKRKKTEQKVTKDGREAKQTEREREREK